ncbi:BamA/TamA family outer membrane protein [Carboxylicivirga sp. M1479]|uniref:BamA/TamA family outer membrane protein n=1 Tax=Carboxylicivirga sp. M1479 TaxID=2594476 RepID=UPI0011781AEA|nr:BamA/TamA family outer membrane protein [Carboxylicivirga sp. M1479]TRX63315.1 BamA/TamA family outer membrane protein [Carboxylicivirga sp. M1479]
MRNIFIACLFLIVLPHLSAQKKMSIFTDSLDQSFDVSDFLITKKGLLPVPMLITEPSVGYGGAMGLLYFHDSYENKKRPPSISGAFGGYTQNGTWMAGALHAGYWREDRIRYVGFVGKVNINIDYYGPLPKPVEMNMSSWIIMQKIQFRISESNFFTGLQYNYTPAQNTFKLPIDIPEFNGIEYNTNISEITALFIYDSRNNVLSPTAGILAQIAPSYSDKWLGGDQLYGKINASIMGLHPINKKLSVGAKFVSNSKLGDIPFYIKPFVQMRGVPFLKYQGNNVMSLEAEADYNLYKRWHLIGFAGYGNAFQDYSEISAGNTVLSGGGGFRYLIARKFGMKMGMDFAFSPDEFAFYITVGHAWLF